MKTKPSRSWTKNKEFSFSWIKIDVLKISSNLAFLIVVVVVAVIVIFFLSGFFFHNHFLSQQSNHRTAGEGGTGEGGISLTPQYHFHQLHSHLDISRATAAESSPLHIGSSRTRAGNLWFHSIHLTSTFQR